MDLSTDELYLHSTYSLLFLAVVQALLFLNPYLYPFSRVHVKCTPRHNCQYLTVHKTGLLNVEFRCVYHPVAVLIEYYMMLSLVM